MQPSLERLRDERGMSVVFVSVALMGLFAATTLAVDVGMFMAARSQAQNSADAAALAGATALVKNSYTDRTAAGPAVLSAINTATSNSVMSGVPSVLPADVTFPNDPAGEPNRVRVRIAREQDRGNAIPTLMGSLLGVTTVDIAAIATAEASPANAVTCVKPFMIPDKWIENSDANGKKTGTWTPDSTFDVYDKKGKLLPKPDVYISADRPATYTGYTVTNDRGTELVLRAGTGDQINPSFYFSWKMPGATGGDFYRENIATCNQSIVTWGTTMIQEPGNMVGPTIQGILDLIAKDPYASWDLSCSCVVDSAFGTSPRVFPIPLYDPAYHADGKANGRPADFKAANFLGFFVDHVAGNSIHGRVTDIMGIVDGNTEATVALFPKAIRLVE